MINKLIIVSFLFCLLIFKVHAQEYGCYSPALTPEEQEVYNRLAKQVNSNPNARIKTDEPISLAVTVIIVRKSDGTGGVSEQKVNSGIQEVNDLYSNAGLSFFVSEFVYIDSNTFYNLDVGTERTPIYENFHRPQTINVYMVNTLTRFGQALCGHSTAPGAEDMILMKNSCMGVDKVFSHELAHYFSIRHTFENGSGDELVVRPGGSSNGTLPPNCEGAGDQLCDTPADRESLQNNVNPSCEYTGTATDENGDAFAPHTNNIMSYMRADCTDSFTDGQYSLISAIYANRRSYLSTDLSIIGFELSKQTEPAIIDVESQTVLILMEKGTDLSSLQPVIHVAPESQISPESEVTLDFSGPVTYTVTNSRGESQDWTVSAQILSPFTTVWQVEAGETITLPLNTGYDYDFEYAWVLAGDTLEADTHTSVDGDFSTTLSTAGEYELKILGDFPHLKEGYPVDKLIDLTHWGHVFWIEMTGMFSEWQGTGFTASDVPITRLVTNMSGMFRDAPNFDEDISEWNVGKVIRMNEVFEGATSFNGNISSWDVSRVREMRNMFKRANTFNQDISSWDVSQVTKMSGTFNGASSFNQNIGTWNVSSVTTVNGMFIGATAFNADISSWKVDKVENMAFMFQRAESFNQDISEWETSSITNFQGMFENASSFDQNLASWDVTSATNMKAMLNGSGLSIQNYGQILMNWSEQEVQSEVELGAEGLSYCNDADNGRAILTNEYNWIINDDGADSTACTEEEGDTDEQNDEILGFDEPNKKWSIFPNPAHDFLHIKTTENVEVQLVNLGGHQVIPMQKGNHLKMNLQTVKPGIYVLVIEGSQGIIFQKIRKEN
ncbi:Por secretion system C-terminal sorting domain-containing protein [Reichenbachiella faecimaris]|uniref:Por secretion system C-terminal sorting domain-containing protein n=1 Tax=Reichenbachiella faecimaris TaxID=692418 RepID=A0A1W2G8F7_REIFA|nr:BspA family leucine-rich repeat surface protein [Reichenbachiella faecimaris]SMD32784.1 Por secretion system C-terminal sorting domain-containing protein [Reichenbachiella faecimaris]